MKQSNMTLRLNYENTIIILKRKNLKKNIKKENEYEYAMLISKIEFNKIMIIFTFIKSITNDQFIYIRKVGFQFLYQNKKMWKSTPKPMTHAC